MDQTWEILIQQYEEWKQLRELINRYCGQTN
jgi:hypothetical protein